jgi:tetratricopeptide (TPR) repeat protein
MAAAAIMTAAVVLSGSRAGMLAVMAAIAVWFFAKPKTRNTKLAAAIVMLALPTALYFFKKDSADGRWLIWRASLDMVADKPVLGHGAGAFKAKYMLCQAAYLNARPDSQYAQLAGNTLHPFNEYLLVLCEHGLTGLGMAALPVFLLVGAYRRNRGREKLPALMSLSALAVFSFFSYPFRYPFTWVMLFLNVAVICNAPDVRKVYHGFFAQKRNMLYRNIPRITVLLLSSGLLMHSVLLTQAEIRWNHIAHLSLAGKTGEVLPEYDPLYRYLGKDGLFLYNHAAELHEVKEYAKSLSIFERCVRYYNDMDVQMLLADNYKELHQYGEAEKHLKLAAAMCPVRFMPLYELAKLYDAAGRHEDALTVARQIICKKIKIPSATVTAIKNEMRQLLEKEGTRDSATQGGTSDESKSHEPRQGETPEVSPYGSALPP